MRIRENHALRPQMVEIARIRCRELVAEAQACGRDRTWVRSQLYGEFEADCSAVIDFVLDATKVMLD